MRPPDFVDYYEILGLQQGCTADDVREAWRRCARLYHPDLNPRKTSFRFRRAKEAYDILSDPQHRRDYDRLYRLQKGLFKGAGKRASTTSFAGTPPGGRTPPPPRRAPGPPTRTPGSPGASRPTGSAGVPPGSTPARTGGAAPPPSDARPSASPPGKVPGANPPGANPSGANVRSRTNFRPATIYKEVQGASLIDQLKDAITQGGASRVSVRHRGNIVWETHITSSLMDDLTRWLVGPLASLLHLLGADEQFQVEITNELVEDYNRGNTLYDEGKLEDAKQAYKRCLERDKYFAPAHLSLGAVYEAQQDVLVAIKCYQNTVKIDPAGEAGRFARENLRRLRGY